MTEVDNRIARMPAKMAFAVLDLRKVQQRPHGTSTEQVTTAGQKGGIPQLYRR